MSIYIGISDPKNKKSKKNNTKLLLFLILFIYFCVNQTLCLSCVCTERDLMSHEAPAACNGQKREREREREREKREACDLMDGQGSCVT